MIIVVSEHNSADNDGDGHRRANCAQHRLRGSPWRRGKAPRARFASSAKGTPAAVASGDQRFLICGGDDAAIIRPAHAIDALPAGGAFTHHTCTDAKLQQSFTLLLRHHGLRPGASSVHVVDQWVRLGFSSQQDMFKPLRSRPAASNGHQVPLLKICRHLA